MKHYPVMLSECIDSLNIRKDGIYIDATLGAGGHSEAILKKLDQGKLITFDKDIEAIERSRKKLNKFGKKWCPIHSSYANMETKVLEMGINQVDGILFDLGVSSPQLDDPQRGFSYRFNEKLDMRMDQSQNFSAYEVVNEYSEEDLSHIIWNYGEDRFHRRIAKEIVLRRPLENTFDLVEAIKAAYPMKARQKSHPAKQTFQAIRIEVNNELSEVELAIHQSLDLLKVNGRLVVLTFHSLEDRIVKNIFNQYGKKEKVNPRIPVPIEKEPNYRIIDKGKKASTQELAENHRSHSARLRSIERMK